MTDSRPELSRPTPSAARVAWRGMRLRCPCCGERSLFWAFLKLNRTCPKCGADFSNSETADVAPYLTVFVVGLIATPTALVLTNWLGVLPDMFVAGFLAIMLGLAIFLLPRIKGMLAALLWRARRGI